MGFRLVTALALGAAAVGVVLPLLPTTPFLLVAAWSASRHSPELEARLLAHPHMGPHIRAWRERRALSRRAKVCAGTALAVSFVVTLLLTSSAILQAAVAGILAVVGVYLCTRPEPASEARLPPARPHMAAEPRRCG